MHLTKSLLMLKMGMVLSGHETEEDIKDYLSELDEVNEIKRVRL